MELTQTMSVDFPRALVPAQGKIRPILALEQRGLATFSREDSPRGGIRFVGYGSAREKCVYGTAGRPIHEPKEAGALLDIYV